MITYTMNMPIRKRIARKLAGKKGASLAETMIAMVIMLLALAIVLSGIRLAQKQYHRSVILSEEKVLASSLTNIIQNELANAHTVTIAGEDLVSFIPRTYGLEESECRFIAVNVADDHSISKSSNGFGELLLGTESNTGKITGHLLLSSASYSTYKLKANVQVKYIDDAFHVILTITDPTGESSKTEFDVLPLNDLSI